MKLLHEDAIRISSPGLAHERDSAQVAAIYICYTATAIISKRKKSPLFPFVSKKKHTILQKPLHPFSYRETPDIRTVTQSFLR